MFDNPQVEEMDELVVQSDPTNPIPDEFLNPSLANASFLRGKDAFLRANGAKIRETGWGKYVLYATYEDLDTLKKKFTPAVFERAQEKAIKKGHAINSPDFFQEILCELYQNPHIMVIHIVAGFSEAYDHAYLCIGYWNGEEES